MDIDVESVFNQCQEESEKFKYGKIISQEDLARNPFLFNANKIPGITEFRTTYYEALAKKKEISLNGFHETYWNDLRKRFNESPTDIETFKKMLLDALENKLLPNYFSHTKILFQHYFTQNYSPELFKNNDSNIFNLVASFYIGDYSKINNSLQIGFPGAEEFEKSYGINHISFCENAKNILLDIWDQHVKLTNVIEFPKRAILINSSSKKPVVQIPDYKSITNGSKDQRGIHKKDDAIIPEEKLYEEAKRLYQKEGNKCLSRDNPRFPSEWMKKKLSGKTSNIKLVGYKKGDVNKENPIPLKKGIIRKYLGDNNHRWITKK